MGANAEWEQVLASVEAEARHTAELLHLNQEPGTSPPAEAWSLPSAVLPPLADMPEVPAELRERIEQLRSRIDALRTELADALRDWRQQPYRTLPVVSARPEQPMYMDRCL